MTDEKRFLIGRAIRRLRIARHLSQNGLARLWGVTPSFVSLVETDRRGVSLLFVNKLANAMEIPPSFIYVLADDPEKKVVGALQGIVLEQIEKWG